MPFTPTVISRPVRVDRVVTVQYFEYSSSSIYAATSCSAPSGASGRRSSAVVVGSSRGVAKARSASATMPPMSARSASPMG